MDAFLKWLAESPPWLSVPIVLAGITVCTLTFLRAFGVGRPRKPAETDPAKIAARRRKRRVALAVAVGIPVVLLVGQGIRILLAGSQFSASQDALRSRLGSRTVTRDPWLDPPQDGDSWPAYAEVARKASLLSPGDKEALMNAGDTRFIESAWADSKVIAGREGQLVAELRRAAAHRTITVPIDVEKGHISATTEVSAVIPGLRTIARLILVSAKLKSDSGDWVGAIDDVAVGLQTGCDLARKGPIMAYFGAFPVGGISIEAAARILQNRSIPRTAAVRLAALLERYGREFTSMADAADAERLLIGASLRLIRVGNLEDMKAEHAYGFRLSEWMNGGSLTIAGRDVDRDWTAFVEELRESSTRAWQDAGHLRDRWLARSIGGPWRRPIYMALFIDLSDQAETDRLHRAHLALTLAAARFRAGETGELPQDPFTLRPLHSQSLNSIRKFWSEGVNGDQFGDGTWWGGVSVSRTPDVVLELPE
ncbi:MAG: hypothetical protein K8T20_18135 [Planctomycetes bacterium]|nr:hypothetical protein [Planctomycetota bacterium]